ncbi:LysR family transcriptional regulator [Desulfosarcina cetonica]|uniref:LysR family transcriptional regulator n=1 Tax=Desulfosarcina cetonica TaxID=90730 RepID=UPI0012ED8B00|nr:LysR family transcriptional regulator [Desulfosarcina cetonica]
MITHTQLEYLVAVDRYGSFSKAAEHCFITQPTLSMQIQKLEGELGVALFDRSKKPVQTTPIGRRVIQQAYRALRELAGVAEVVRAPARACPASCAWASSPRWGRICCRALFRTCWPITPSCASRCGRSSPPTWSMPCAGTPWMPASPPPPFRSRILTKRRFFTNPFMLVAANHRLSRHPDIARDDIAAGEMLLLDGGHCLSGQLIQACTGGGEDSDADPARLQFIGGSWRRSSAWSPRAMGRL